MTYHIDLFAIFILLGIVQAIFLSAFFFSRENRKQPANVFHGVMLLAMAGCILEIFLQYTGYIMSCLYLVDFSEPLALVIGPAFYLLVISRANTPITRKHYLHFIFPLLYFVALIPFLVQSNDYKFNSWIDAYHMNLPFRDVHANEPVRFLWITNHHTELSLLSILGYAALSIFFVVKTFIERKESFLQPQDQSLAKIRTTVFTMITSTILIFVVKFFNPDDTGDHLFAAYIGLTVYITSFSIIRSSSFFKGNVETATKYKSSSLTPDRVQALQTRIHEALAKDKPFLNSSFSLPELADKVGITVHQVSQVINESMRVNFFELLAQYRVEEAKKILKAQPHLKIEEVAEQVGYLSKSSFNTAFKKITGQTPSEFRGS